MNHFGLRTQYLIRNLYRLISYFNDLEKRLMTAKLMRLHNSYTKLRPIQIAFSCVQFPTNLVTKLLMAADRAIGRDSSGVSVLFLCSIYLKLSISRYALSTSW